METIIENMSPDGVLHVTLNRPQTRNAFNHEMLEAMTVSFRRAVRDSQTRVVVLGSTGSHFCAGGDIEWMKSVLSAGPEEKRRYAQAVTDMYQAAHALPQPVVAQVRGVAMGGGFGLLCCADLVVAEAQAKFALSETRLGIVPAAISPYVVAALGVRQACRLALGGTLIDAAAAFGIGLVTHMAPADQLASLTDAVLQELLCSASGAQRLTKRLFREMSPQAPSRDSVVRSVDALVEAWSQPEAMAGFSAFLRKSSPPWQPGGAA